MIDDWPIAILANGPACTMHGWYSAVLHSVGLMALRIHAHIAPATSRSPVVTGIAALVESHGDLAQTFAQVRQVAHDRQNRHQLRARRDAELRLHHVTVGAVADPDDDFAQGLRAEIHHPAHLDAGGSISSRRMWLRRASCSSL